MVNIQIPHRPVHFQSSPDRVRLPQLSPSHLLL